MALDGLMFRQFFDVIGNERLQVKFSGPKAPVVCLAGPDHEFIIMPLSRDSDYSSPKNVEPAKPEPPKEEPPRPDEGGSAPVEPTPTEPPVPVGATPEAHRDNGKARVRKAR
jgi:hypothetical protein